jgi:hypothetical protein
MLNREISTDEYLGTPEDEQAFDAFVYAGFAEQIHRLAKGYSKAEFAKARLWEQANPRPISAPERRVVAEEDTHVGAGKDKTSAKRIRAHTTAEQMHKTGTITFEEWQAAGALRTKYILEVASSEGVSSYGDQGGSRTPWLKGDAKAASILRNRTNTRELADMLFAMVGSYDEEGNKIFDPEMAALLVRSVVETVDAVTLTDIGRARTHYTGEKQTSAAGGAILKECYRRGAAHLRYLKALQWPRDAELLRRFVAPKIA